MVSDLFEGTTFGHFDQLHRPSCSLIWFFSGHGRPYFKDTRRGQKRAFNIVSRHVIPFVVFFHQGFTELKLTVELWLRSPDNSRPYFWFMGGPENVYAFIPGSSTILTCTRSGTSKLHQEGHIRCHQTSMGKGLSCAWPACATAQKVRL